MVVSRGSHRARWLASVTAGSISATSAVVLGYRAGGSGGRCTTRRRGTGVESGCSSGCARPWRRRLGLHHAAGHEGVDVLIVVVEPLGVVLDEVAVDQVVEDQRPLLAVGVAGSGW